jgi:flavodoxin
MASIQILVGSVFGGAEQLADIAASRLRELGHHVSINTWTRPEDLARDPHEILLLCHSNTGAGDLPDNIQPLYIHLTRDLPRIAGRRYGVINLADSSYSTFNEGGQALDAAFADLGAERIGEPLVLDACSGDDPGQLTLEWINEWANAL